MKWRRCMAQGWRAIYDGRHFSRVRCVDARRIDRMPRRGATTLARPQHTAHFVASRSRRSTEAVARAEIFLPIVARSGRRCQRRHTFHALSGRRRISIIVVSRYISVRLIIGHDFSPLIGTSSRTSAKKTLISDACAHFAAKSTGTGSTMRNEYFPAHATASENDSPDISTDY